jgi:hypothetical protein
LAPYVSVSLAGTSLTSVSLAWTGNADQGYEVQRSIDGVNFSAVADVPSSTTTFQDTGLSGNQYFYQVEALHLSGSPETSNIIAATVGQAIAVAHVNDFSLPADLTVNGTANFVPQGNPVGIFAAHQDLGPGTDPSIAGNATFDNSTGTYSLTASGSDIWNNFDNMHFVYEPLVGDGEIIARMVSATAPDFWTKGGLMFRSAISSSAANAFMLETPNSGHEEPVQQWRDSNGAGSGDTGNHNNHIQAAPLWLRLNRTGNVFTGYWAHDNGDGTHGDWNQMAAHTTVMPTTVYVGLALTAHSNGSVGTANFDNVTVTGTAGPLAGPTVLQLTDSGNGEAGSSYTIQKIDARRFFTTFTFQFLPGSPPADGMAFVLQNSSTTALGGGGGGLGYSGVPNSVAVVFRAYDHSQTGIGTGGNFTTPTIDLTGSGIDFTTNDVFSVGLSYDGHTLTETITDLTTPATFVHAYAPLNIPTTIGGDNAYAGFSAGTGGFNLTAQVQNWTYQPSSQVLPPLAPSNVVIQNVTAASATASNVTVGWTSNSFNETGFQVQRSPNGFVYTIVGSTAAGVTTFTDTNVGAGRFFYRVVAFNRNGRSSPSAADSLINGSPGQVVPAINHGVDFSSHTDLTTNGSATFAGPVGVFAGHQDVGTSGDPSVAGSASFNAGTYTVTGSGSDVWDVSDHMQILYQTLSGDGSIIARVASTQGGDRTFGKAGVVFRDSLATGAANAFMLQFPNDGGRASWPTFQWRSADAATTSDAEDQNNEGTIWVRLDRVGNVFTAFWAHDMGGGQHGPFNMLGSPQTIPMGAVAYVGLAVTSHQNGSLMTATFDNVSITGTTGALPPNVLRLTDGNGNEDGSSYTNSRVGVANFSTSFQIQFHNGSTPPADGMAFVLQGVSPSALFTGGGGGGLGYGPDHPGGPQGIPNSICIKFDIYNNQGEGTDSTGLFLDGDSPTIPSGPRDTLVDLTNSGIVLNSGHVFGVYLSYNGSILTEAIVDTTTLALFATSYQVDIPGAIGGNLAYAGFSGGTGGLTTTGDVLNWTYTFRQPSFTGPAPHGSGSDLIGLVGLPVTGGSTTPAPSGTIGLAPASGGDSLALADLIATDTGSRLGSVPGLYQSLVPGSSALTGDLSGQALDPSAVDTLFSQV